MKVQVQFWSWFKELAETDRIELELAPGATIDDLLHQVFQQKPQLEKVRRSMLVAVGVEYQPADYQLKEGDQVSLFPPVQGG